MKRIILIIAICALTLTLGACQGRTESHAQAFSQPYPTMTPLPTPPPLPRATVRLRDMSLYHRTPTPDYRAATPDPGWAGFLHLVHKEVNRVRRSGDSAGLDYDPFLAEIAQGHSEDMAKRGELDHLGSNGKGPQDRLVNSRAYKLGWRCTPDIPERPGRYAQRVRFGENLLETRPENIGRQDAARAAEVVESWLMSPPHRDNLMKRTFQRQGLGLAVADNDQAYITQLLCFGWGP